MRRAKSQPVRVRGRSWSFVVVRGRARSFMVVRGRSWSCMVVHGRAWSCVVVHGCARPFMVVHGRSWSFMVVRGRLWSCVAVRGRAPRGRIHTRAHPPTNKPPRAGVQTCCPYQCKRIENTRIVNIMKMYLYMERKNMQFELIRFRKKNIAFIHVYFFEPRNSTRLACLRLDSRYSIRLFDSNPFMGDTSPLFCAQSSHWKSFPDVHVRSAPIRL